MCIRDRKTSGVSDTVKVLNLSKVLARTVEEEADQKPFLRSIGELARQVAEAYETRQKDTQEALEQYELFAERIIHATEERQSLGLDPEAYAVYLRLREWHPGLTADQAKEISEEFERFPNHAWDSSQSRALRTALYKRLVSLIPKTFVDAVNALLKIERA